MAGATRGKIKEHLEGLHRNFDWAQNHCEKIVGLVGPHNAPLTDAMKTLDTELKVLDKLVQGLYGKI